MSELDEYKELVRKQQAEIADLKEQIAYLTRKIYVSKSERVDPNQTSLFKEENSVFTEPEQTGEKSDTSTDQVQPKKKAKKTRKETLNPNLPVRITVKESKDHRCPKGHSGIITVGKKFVREELRIIPAHAYVERIYTQTYKCKKCIESVEDIEDLINSGLFQADVPPALIPHSLASASLIAEVAYRKFVLDVPLYRQLPELRQLGYQTSEATLANWMIKLAEFLMPLYNELHYRLLSYKELQGDETLFQVLREDGKSPTSKSYIWLVTTPRKLSEQVVYYAYSPTRSGAFAQKLYQGFHGVLQCDGYSGYNLLSDCIERTGCWAHVRRKFYDAFKSHVKDAEMPLKLLNRMFKLEREWQPLSPKARRKRRRGQLKKIVNCFWRLLQQIETLPNSRLGKAIAYAQSQKVYLNRILNNGVIDWSNNASERNMKTFVIGRKNWLFSTSTKGAKANAIWMTIVESAKANHLDPRQYIKKLLEKLPTLPAFPKKEELAAYLPWNQNFNQVLEA